MKNRFFAGAAAALCCAAGAMAQSANDLCANAIALSVDTPTAGAVVAADTNDSPTNTATNNGCGTTFLGTTRKSVYYTFTPGATGLYEVSLCASSGTLTDTRLAIYAATDTTPGSVAPCSGSVAALACNDDSCGTRSNFNVNLTAGAGYIIQVAPFSTSATAAGTFVILVHGPQSAPPPGNDDCASPVALTSGSPTAGDLTNATGTSTTVYTCGTTSTTGNDLWYSCTPAAAGTTSVDVCGNFDAIVNVLTAASTCAAPASLACNDDTIPTGCTLHGSRATWTAVANTTYLVRVAGVQHSTSTPSGIAPAHGAFTITFTEPQPLGSCCNFNTGACTSVTQASCGTAGAWTIGGTCSPDPCPKGACCNDVTGICTTGGTQCAAGMTYQGPGSVCSPSPCPPNGSCCVNSCCNVVLPAYCPAPGVWTAGGVCSPNPCTVVPSNDLCVNAIPLTVGVTTVGSNCGATGTASSEGPAPSCQSSSVNGVWYTVTPAATGYYSVSTCGATFDSIITVFTTPDCVTFAQVSGGCDDDSCAGGEPGPLGNSGSGTASNIAAVGLCAGQTYHIRITNWSSGTTGTFPLTVASSTSTSGACCSDVTGACTVATTQTACETSANLHWQGAGTTCCPGACPQPVGACCAPDGTCTETAANLCTAPSLFQGGTTTCSAGACPVATTACCNNSTGVCVFQTSTTCASGSTATGSTCSPIPCPTGACCNDVTGVCTTGGTICATGSTYQGAGTTCSPNPCPANGSCCIGTCCYAPIVASLCTAGSWVAGGTCSPDPCPPPPANDLCSGAIALTLGTPMLGTNCGAADDGSNDTCGGSGNRRSVWYTFTPTHNAAYSVGNCGANFDSVISVWSGPCGAQTSVACDDDSCAGGEPGPGPVLAGDSQASRIASVVLTGGTTYYVRVGSFDYTSSPIETGSFQVVVSNVNPLGACCETSGACTQTDAARCTVAGAVFTAGNACSPNSCPQPGACCDPATGGCTLASVIGGTGCPVGNTYLGDNTTCTPNTCPQPDGACCCGSSCSLTPPAACTGTNTQFMGTGTVCNVAGNNTTPCCRADYNQSGSVSVQDIFDFLGGYFSLNPCADVNGSGPPPSVQDIFDFLAAYFAGCV